MLVLSRKKNQKIVIGEEIVITVVEVRGDTVRLGFEAPKDIRVLRGELVEPVVPVVPVVADNPEPLRATA